MPKCPVCRSRMNPVLAKISVRIGDTIVETIGDAHECKPCKQNITAMEVKIQPLVITPTEKKDEEPKIITSEGFNA